LNIQFEYSNLRQTLTGIKKGLFLLHHVSPFLLLNRKHARQFLDFRCIACQNNYNARTTTFPVASLPPSFAFAVSRLHLHHSLLPVPCLAFPCLAFRSFVLPCLAMPSLDFDYLSLNLKLT
jgi:hypothetical protein